MANQDIAAALGRVEAVLRRRPEIGLHEDAPATARWAGGTRIVASHPNGMQVQTDMPTELGGSGDQVSPGWLLRAGLASCAATTIAMQAAAEGIVLDALEVHTASRSDARGLLGMRSADGALVYPGPGEMRMHVRIGAAGVPAERLRALVERSSACAPTSCAVREATPVALQIEVDGAGG